ncbi:hypothetical protein SAY86_031196 [Trapa natans]|uniref:WRKY domain-containing protein n=1 Tax=Trapa natans TaxID=22666 RepID=A0AAN7LLI4_TRANT|nr:hypothetical protein SAY86_031196 [Trapa natans]
MPGFTCQALQPQAKNQPVSSPCRTWSEFTPTSTGLSMTSDSNIRNPCSPMENLQNACRNKPTMSLTPIRSACADGYIWRKYGQKQVKIPQGFRSYFRCGHSECCAKKIEFSDQSGYVMEIIYKSGHSHDPPGKVNSVRESRILKNAGSLIENNTGENSNKVFNGSIPLASSIKTLIVFGEEHADSNGFNEDAETTFKSEDAIEPVTKHWRKKHGTSLPSPLSKREKKPKFVVHATGDGDMSGDGYRWRKYGQKIVKGKP